MWWSVSISQSQRNITLLRIPTGRRQTSWLFTSVADIYIHAICFPLPRFLLLAQWCSELLLLFFLLAVCISYVLLEVITVFLFIFVGKDQLLSLSRFQPKNCWRKGGHRHRQVRFYPLPLFCHSYNQSRWLFCGNLATFCRTIGSLTEWSNLKTSRPNSLSRVANVLA